MEAIIVLFVSATGAYFCNIDFCVLHTFVSIAVALYKNWINYANDKTARRCR